MLQTPKKSITYEKILADFYQQFISQEIASQRPQIEFLHFLCSSFMMEKLLQIYQESLQKREDDQVSARKELNEFITYMVNQNAAYLNESIRDELLTLSKNRHDDQYLSGYSQFYRYCSITTTSIMFEKINYISEYLKHQNQIFQDFKNKLKFNQYSNSDCFNTNRYATLSGLFYFNKQIGQMEVNAKDDKLRDLRLIEENMKTKEKYFNTFIEDDWLRIIVQIEKCQKSHLDPLSQQDFSEIQQLIEQKQLPYQIANQMKQEVIKKLQQRKQQQQQSQENNNEKQVKYSQLIKYKLSHDTKLIECLLNQQKNVLGIKLQDLPNVISYIQISKFCKIICCGCYDGNILIYDMNELKQNRQNRLLCNPSFEMHIHEGPVTAISILYDENYIISVSVDLTIKFSCLKSRQPLVVYKGHLQTIWHLAFAPMGYWFASASSDGTALLWATDQNQCIRIFGPVMNQVKLVEFVPSVEYVVTAEENRIFRIWSIDKAECLYISFMDGNITCMNVSFTGQFLSIGCDSGSVVLYYLPMTKLLKEKIYLQRSDFHSANGRDYIRSVSISLDETTLMCCNSNRIGFFNISDLMKKTSEDVFKGLEQSIKSIEYEKNNWSRNAIPIELLELQDYIHLAQYVCNGFALYVCK
ncbi:unnamed protein product [Paramecium octaurelia]|uniref:WD domain, G-beta repeat protein n=1 Tax=Paramecium octaurelia TaxID=43137 RepID=A0A8S1S4G2_PAROT|nr:unnamed protein product [Paramecium octaurelia]